MNVESPTSLVVASLADQHTSVFAQLEQALGRESSTHLLPTLTNVALGDPYLAQQLVDLHQNFELRPQPQSGLIGRLRSRLAWWLLGPELIEVNRVHATMVRVLDSLIVQLDQDRAARRRLEEQLAWQEE